MASRRRPSCRACFRTGCRRRRIWGLIRIRISPAVPSRRSGTLPKRRRPRALVRIRTQIRIRQRERAQIQTPPRARLPCQRHPRLRSHPRSSRRRKRCRPLSRRPLRCCHQQPSQLLPPPLCQQQHCGQHPHCSRCRRRVLLRSPRRQPARRRPTLILSTRRRPCWTQNPLPWWSRNTGPVAQRTGSGHGPQMERAST